MANFRKSLSLFKTIASSLQVPARHLTLRGAVPASRPYLAAGLSRELGRPLLVVTATTGQAELFCRELRFFLPSDTPVLHFPSWEVLPFEPLSPSLEISAERISTLSELITATAPVVVAPLEAVLQFLIPRGRFASARLELRKGDSLVPQRFFRRLLERGYERAGSVEVIGEFSHRGGIIDLFPPSLPSPVRLELLGDAIESIRPFDPESQRSTGGLEKVHILPAREIILDKAILGALKKHLTLPEGRGGEEGLLGEAAGTEGLEHYQSLLSRSRQTILDYFSEPPLVVLSEFTDLESRAIKFRQEVRQEAGRATLPDLYDPEGAYLDFGRWQAGLHDHHVVYLDSFGLSPPESETIRIETSSARSFVLAGRSVSPRESPMESTVRQLRNHQAGERIVIVAESEESAGRLRELCGEQNMGTSLVPPEEVQAWLDGPRPGAPRITWGALREGFRYRDAGILFVTEEDIFGSRIRLQAPRPSGKKSLLPDFHLLKPGDFLVHLEHGIGVYGGLTRLLAGGEEADFLVISYQGGDKVYIPAHAMDSVQRYISWEGHQPRIDRLGGKMWATTKRKAKKALLTLARDLLRLYAVRHSTPGHAFPPDTTWQVEFEMGFEYTATEDQLRAAEEVKSDMEKAHPMDRLVCGDVGFGKTEVAMRAAFKAVMDSKQVAVLAPTTILVQQHLSTFLARFASYPVRIEMLSRFVRPSEQKKIAVDLAAGKVDIIIGTHRLLGRDVSFNCLGLVIIDEEQRFGVRQKEALKKLRETVDVLSLTATPIPRTLYQSLSGIRELSQMTTPPESRLAVSNTVTRFDRDIIVEAVLRELRRGGQVFFIHNRVKSIRAIGSYLSKILPEIRIGTAHGQMSEKELQRVMSLFREGEYDLLLCTAIVESGLDIPNANTMFINRADTFGLAELYQLRGRIGRSRRRAYAYFLVPAGGALSPSSQRRIEVIRDFAHLGAGFQIALYDLEIRGAGSVLGYRQSGHIAAVGFELYSRLLQETIRELQGEPHAEERPTRVSFALSSFFPEDYMPQINHRLSFYKKIAEAAAEPELEDIAEELGERFGPLPETVLHLLWAARLKIQGERLGVQSLDWKSDALELVFYPQGHVPAEKIVSALQGAPPGSRMKGENHLCWTWKTRSETDRLAEALSLLQGLG